MFCLVATVCHCEEGLLTKHHELIFYIFLLGVIISNLVDYISIRTDAELFISFQKILYIHTDIYMHYDT